MEALQSVMQAVHPYMQQINAFRFIKGETPFSGYLEPWATVVLYYITLRVLQQFMKNRKAYEFRAFLFVHNMLLSIGSLILFVALVYVLAEKSQVFNLRQMICAPSMHFDGRLQFIYYINYFFKYYELIDTVLLVLRKKPVPFLHEYHHAATLILTWSQQREHSTVQWVPIVLNLLVHVLMYYYYAMSAIGVRIWWKQYLTSLQISQFIIDVIACSYAYAVFIFNGFDYNSCYGTQTGAIQGILILSSYLFLFIRFYQQTYKSSGKGKKEE
eukprot:CAMPEP_0184693166 /NCGR_PEP_ID=MMETSP0313-20130426/1446_1 /TAXON_ID=2792 /ORGANISM="Porphyridium aerugineum, Strain SAG 1380-2" /LENGTH=270 /DNA_ID=CAMNT_0027151157 /DNA_START=143 /DNA_END=955 /DNA_ORIENTATION=+